MSDKLENYRPQRRNANRHTQRGLGALETSIQRDGWIGAVTVAADGETFDGSARLEVGAATGFEDAIVIESDGSKPIIHVRTDIATADDPRAKRLGLAANFIASVNLDFDPAIILADLDAGLDLSALWNSSELDEMAKALGREMAKGEDAGPQTDKAAELQAKWGTALGQVWCLGEHRLVCGDCTDRAVVEAVMQGEKAALCVTSPPYWVGREYEQEHGADEIRGHIELAAYALSLAVAQPGHIALNTGMTTENRQGGDVRHVWLLLDWWAEVLRKYEWYMRNVRIWRKEGGFASFAPSQDLCGQNWEFLASFASRKLRPQNRLSGGGADVKWALDGVWDCQPQTVSVGHTAPFPVEIPSRYIQLYTNETDMVYEPYCGSGTTLVACEQLGRKGRGVELSPAYVAVTLDRWSTMTGREPRQVSV